MQYYKYFSEIQNYLYYLSSRIYGEPVLICHSIFEIITEDYIKIETLEMMISEAQTIINSL